MLIHNHMTLEVGKKKRCHCRCLENSITYIYFLQFLIFFVLLGFECNVFMLHYVSLPFLFCILKMGSLRCPDQAWTQQFSGLSLPASRDGRCELLYPAVLNLLDFCFHWFFIFTNLLIYGTWTSVCLAAAKTWIQCVRLTQPDFPNTRACYSAATLFSV